MRFKQDNGRLVFRAFDREAEHLLGGVGRTSSHPFLYNIRKGMMVWIILMLLRIPLGSGGKASLP